MLIYIFIIITSLTFGIIANAGKKSYINNPSNQKKMYYIILSILSFFPPFIVSGLRSPGVGTDTLGTYLDIFNLTLNPISVYNLGIRDVGYGYLNKLSIFFFGNNYSAVLIITSFIIVGLSYYSIYKESKNIPLSIILFFTMNIYFISMNMIRQSIATMIFIFSIRYIKNKSLFKYLICILIAISFHTTSVVYLPMYFIFNITPNIKKMIISVVVIVFFGIFISNFLINIFLKIAFFRTYFAWYINSSFNTGNINLVSLIISFLIFVYLLSVYKNAKNDKDYKISIWCQFIALICLIFSAKLPLMQRTSWLFSFVQFVYLPNTFQYIKSKNERFIWQYGICLGYAAYMIVTTFIMHYNEVVPYSSILG